MTLERFGHNSVIRDARHIFEEGVSRWWCLAYRAAYCILRSTADAEDVTQEALLRAYDRLGL
jgi:DNA-directed RNA polymerase specialized sigma24 family protein